MKRIILLLGMALMVVQTASAKLIVGASLPDLGSIASYVGGDRIEVFSIARSTSDPHSVEVLPSYMVRVSRADVYLKVGLSLDQWADQIIEGARNSKLRIVDCSSGVAVLEKPTTKVTAAQGDVHPDGNPHYWLDPQNGISIARTIAEALTAADPANAAAFAANLQRFEEETAQRLNDWKAISKKLPGHAVVSYHSSWVYFAHAFDLEIAAKIEPVPGIPPTASHLADLVKTIREGHVGVVIQEPYFSDDGAKYLSRETGVRVLKLAPSCNDVSASSYFAHFQQILDALQSVN